MRKFVIFGVVGAAAGTIAAVVGNFLMPRMEFGEVVNSRFNARRQYAYDQPYEYLTYFLLGALLCSVIALLSNEPKGVKVQFRSFWVGAFLGGALSAGANTLVNYLAVQAALRISPDGILSARDTSRVHDVFFYSYYVLVPLALAFALGISIGMNRFMAVRSLIAAGLACCISYVFIHIALLIILPIVAVQLASNPRNFDVSSAIKPMMIAHLFGMGLGAAVAFAVAQILYKPAWLKGISGRLEGRSLPIPAPVAVIGCQEAVNIYLPPDGTVMPNHAQIDSDEDSHFIRSVMGEVSINGNSVQERWLTDGDIVQIGSYRFTYRNRLSPQHSSAPPPTISQATPVAMPISGPAPSASPSAALGGITLVDPMGGSHPIGPGKTVIGRDEAADISLKWESTVSRRHVEIHSGPAGVTVTDLGSSNGTFVNGIAVASSVALKPGDELRLGRCVLQVK